MDSFYAAICLCPEATRKLMKASYIICAIALGAAVEAGCSSPEGPEVQALCRDPSYDDLCHLDVSKAHADASDALREGDTRLIGIRGYSVAVPGVQLGRFEVEAKFGLQTLNENADVVAGSAHMFLIERATKYAEIYNNTKIAEMTARTGT